MEQPSNSRLEGNTANVGAPSVEDQINAIGLGRCLFRQGCPLSSVKAALSVRINIIVPLLFAATASFSSSLPSVRPSLLRAVSAATLHLGNAGLSLA